jgi:adenosylmethionine-8-amino-7-oxononanoate aminotransferase
MTTIDHRLAARDRILGIIAAIEAAPDAAAAPLIDECRALARAIEAFHMEGIRFRMFNVDRWMSRPEVSVPDQARHLFAQARESLEAAGFHTRSHQAPS